MADLAKPINADDNSDGTALPSSALVQKFCELPAGDKKSAFYHANPSLGLIFNGVHFPKAAEKLAAKKPDSKTAAAA